MDWGSILGNVASGGVLGLLGTVVSESIGFFRRKQEFTQRLALAQDERETLKLKADVTAAEMAGLLAKAREEGASNAFIASQRAEAAIKGEAKWVSTLRGFTRPGITWYGLVLTTAFVIFPPSSTIGQELAVTVNIYTGMMISWWFGQRAIDKGAISWGNRTAGASVNSTQAPNPTR